MRFSEIDPSRWADLKPYLDTCLLPLTGLSGEETPGQAAQQLERLRDLMDLVEIPFKGRIVTYPAMQYKTENEQFITVVNSLCTKLKEANFKYVIVISADPYVASNTYSCSDLLISTNLIEGVEPAPNLIVAALLKRMWESVA